MWPALRLSVQRPGATSKQRDSFHWPTLSFCYRTCMKSSMFCDITLCSSLRVNRRFGGICRLSSVRATADVLKCCKSCKLQKIFSVEWTERMVLCGPFKELGHKSSWPFECANPPGRTEENNEQYNSAHPVPRPRLEPHTRLYFWSQNCASPDVYFLSHPDWKEKEKEKKRREKRLGIRRGRVDKICVISSDYLIVLFVQKISCNLFCSKFIYFWFI
jgi:hypothetical protein